MPDPHAVDDVTQYRDRAHVGMNELVAALNSFN